MKYLLPLLICLFLAAPVYAQEDADNGYVQQDEGADDQASVDVPDDTSPEEPGADMEDLRSRAAEYKAQLAEEMPSAEEMKELADKYNIQAPSAEDVRNFGTRHQGKFNKALDYAKQFQEFRREQAESTDGNDSGAMAPAE